MHLSKRPFQPSRTDSYDRLIEAFTNALRPFGTAKYLYLIELHLKKCFVQIILEFSLVSSVLMSLHMGL